MKIEVVIKAVVSKEQRLKDIGNCKSLKRLLKNNLEMTHIYDEPDEGFIEHFKTIKEDPNVMKEMKEDLLDKCILDPLGLDKLNKEDYTLSVKINFMEATN